MSLSSILSKVAAVVLGGGVALGALVAGASNASAATLAYRSDGHHCLSTNIGNPVFSGADIGPLLTGDGYVDWTCSLPLGPSTMMVATSPLLTTINVRYQILSTTASIYSSIVLHDYDSADWCSCAYDQAFNLGVGYHYRSLDFECAASCSSYGSWAANLEFARTSPSNGDLRIKLISAYTP